MNLADLVLIGYGVLFGFACGCAVTAAIAAWGIGLTPDMEE